MILRICSLKTLVLAVSFSVTALVGPNKSSLAGSPQDQLRSESISEQLRPDDKTPSAQGDKSRLTPLKDSSVKIRFTGDPPPFPENFLKSPIFAQATFLDPIQDSAAIERLSRFLREELTHYPPVFLEKNLKNIYVMKSLFQEGVKIGGFSWIHGKRLYLQDNGIGTEATEEHMRSILHHELAHLLIGSHSSHFSRRRWERLNPPSFRYGKGGLESIRTGTSGVNRLNPDLWEQGFTFTYGMAEWEEDFACCCESVFSGDPRFWQAVERYDVLNKKVKMVIAFYHSLDSTMDEAYFRRITPFPRTPVQALAPPIPHYHPGDTIFFPNGGKIITTDNPPKIVEYPPGSAAIFTGKDIVEWYSAAKEQK